MALSSQTRKNTWWKIPNLHILSEEMCHLLLTEILESYIVEEIYDTSISGCAGEVVVIYLYEGGFSNHCLHIPFIVILQVLAKLVLPSATTTRKMPHKCWFPTVTLLQKEVNLHSSSFLRNRTSRLGSSIVTCTSKRVFYMNSRASR
jgi:hypothetical protein